MHMGHRDVAVRTPVARAFDLADADAARAHPQARAALKRRDLRAVIIDGFIVDKSDALPEALAAMQRFCAPTLMSNDSDGSLRAQAALRAADGSKSAGLGVQ